MLILDKNYIFDPLKEIQTDELVIYCSDAYDNKREECIGLYSEPRIPICYNAGTGRVFDKLLNTSRQFLDYAKEVSSICPSLHDNDEIYFGIKVFQNNKNVKIHKLKRGYSSKFFCPGRIERPQSENYFNSYEKENLKKNDWKDIHLSRPFFKHKEKIEQFCNDFFPPQKEVFVIGCHIVNKEQEAFLSELLCCLSKKNKDFILVSHTSIIEELTNKSLAYIYDSINPTYKSWELKNFPKFICDVGPFAVKSPYVSYGSSNYYHVGVLRLLQNAINYLKNTSYEIIHWIEYDALPNFELIEEATKSLENDKDFIFYGIGSQFSFKKRKINYSFLNASSEELLIFLSQHDYLAEKVIQNLLIDGKIEKKFMKENSQELKEISGRYSQKFDLNKIEWSLFRKEDIVNLFIFNHSLSEINVEITSDYFFKEMKIGSNTWYLFPLMNDKKIEHLKIVCDGEIIEHINLPNKIFLEKLVDVVEFIQK